MIFDVASKIWSQVNRVSRTAYKKGWFNSTRFPCRVISVGNIQVGGAGKTPLVMKIAQEAVTQGLRVCILSRGYRSTSEKAGALIFPGSEILDPNQSGDEVALIHSLVPAAWIGVGADRVSQFRNLSVELKEKGELPIDLVILDDGYQHLKIQRDLDIIAITDASSSEIVFRESVNSVPKEAMLVLTKGAKFPTALQAHPHLVQIHYGFGKPPANNRYYFVTGLADPIRAKEALILAGYPIEAHVFLGDHHAYQIGECQAWLKKAKDLGLKVLLTGKDAVKWQALGFESHEYEMVEPTVEIVRGLETWNRLIWSKA